MSVSTKVHVREKVKLKLDILATNTDFDTLIDEAVEQAFPRLSPFIQKPLIDMSTYTLAAGDDTLTLSSGLIQLQKLYTRWTSSDKWQEQQEWLQQPRSTTVTLLFNVSVAQAVKVVGSQPYVFADADVAEIQASAPSALLPLYLFAMAEFTETIVANKRKFNMYQQSNGVRTLTEMQDLVTHYETRAVRILEDELSAEGN